MKKGDFGYIENRKKHSVLLAAAMLVLILAIYFIALAYFKTNQNFFSIAAALLCLPEGKLVINMIMFLRAKGCSAQLHENILKAFEESGTEKSGQEKAQAYDLYLTTYSKNFQLSHLCARGSHVIAVTEDPQCDLKEGEQHIRRMLQSNGFHGYSVKIFRDAKQYVNRIPAVFEEAGTAEENSQEGILSLIKAISL